MKVIIAKQMGLWMRALATVIVGTGCASGRTPAEVDAAVDVDGGAVDAAVADGAIDAATIDAMPIDAACTPTWQDLLVNGAFDDAVIVPWTQTATIIRTAAMMPFAPHTSPHAAEFGATNNANDVLTQTVTIPAGTTGLRVRGYECHVTEDPISDADTFIVTLETPGGSVLETFLDISNTDTAPICEWSSFTWTAASPHAGETAVLRFRGRTNPSFLTRFIVDTVSFEALTCP